MTYDVTHPAILIFLVSSFQKIPLCNVHVTSYSHSIHLMTQPSQYGSMLTRSSLMQLRQSDSSTWSSRSSSVPQLEDYTSKDTANGPERCSSSPCRNVLESQEHTSSPEMVRNKTTSTTVRRITPELVMEDPLYGDRLNSVRVLEVISSPQLKHLKNLVVTLTKPHWSSLLFSSNSTRDWKNLPAFIDEAVHTKSLVCMSIGAHLGRGRPGQHLNLVILDPSTYGQDPKILAFMLWVTLDRIPSSSMTSMGGCLGAYSYKSLLAILLPLTLWEEPMVFSHPRSSSQVTPIPNPGTTTQNATQMGLSNMTTKPYGGEFTSWWNTSKFRTASSILADKMFMSPIPTSESETLSVQSPTPSPPST